MDGSSNNGQVFLDPNSTMDPSMGFVPYDLQAYNQPSLQPPMHNGVIRNASPAFQNQPYQVPSAIPSKRPLPRGESVGPSPAATRPETPQQGGAFPNYQGNQQFSQPHGYPHLQAGGSANASPSPVMQNQQYRGPGGGQRVQTASPSPFSSASQGFAPNQQDPTGRMNTPQGYMQYPNPGQPVSMMTPQQQQQQQAFAAPNPQQAELNRNHQLRLAQYRQRMMDAQSMKPQSGGPKTSPTRGQPNAARGNNPEQFLKSVAQFMSKQGHRFETNPIVCDRRIPLATLYTVVMKKSGSRKVTQMGLWPMIASELGLSQFSTAAQELKDVFERNLGSYEEAWMQSQAQKIRGQPEAQQNQAPAIKGPPLQQDGKIGKVPAVGNVIAADVKAEGPNQPPSTNFEPKTRVVDTYGGFDVKVLGNIGTELINIRPSHPQWHEMGNVDIHSITMSLQSGVTKDVRWALDTLATLTYEQRITQGIQLARCEGLVDSLIDCAEEQVGILVEDMESPNMQLPFYEQVVRNAKTEASIVQEIPLVDTTPYRQDRAVERLICITTIIRNLSFSQQNFPPLVDSVVIKFIANLLRLASVNNLLLRSWTNLLDLMKDLLTFFSNLSHTVELENRDEGLPILSFLLAFAPAESPVREEGVMFPPYQPALHTYLSAAVDSLAKLLARDEPNRSTFKSIFQGDGPPYDLLTRAFALAVAPAAMSSSGISLATCAEARKPFLSQGMLAADILTTMIPTPELARSWLISEDGFAPVLLKLVSTLSMDRGQNPPMPGHPRPDDQDGQSFATITQRGLSVLRRLSEKARAVDHLPVGVLPKKESILGTLLTHRIDASLVRQLVTYAELEA